MLSAVLRILFCECMRNCADHYRHSEGPRPIQKVIYAQRHPAEAVIEMRLIALRQKLMNRFQQRPKPS